MSTQPRNPRHFPRMKVRGSQRRRIAWSQRVLHGFDRLLLSAKLTAQHMQTLREAIRETEAELDR